MRTMAVILVLSISGYAQVPLTEELAPGTIFRTELTLELKGTMKFERNSRIEDAPLEATGKHIYLERFDSTLKSYRHYLEAKSATTVGVERGEKTLPASKRLFVVERTKESASPATSGPLTREELSLVAEHFDAQRIPELLPGKTINVGESWPIRDEVAAGLCLFDAITKNELSGKLLEVKDNVARFSIEGKIEGLEHGAKAKISIVANGEFDLATKRVTKLTWEQSDLREQGPVSPAMEAKVKVMVVRSQLSSEPAELAPERIGKLVEAKKVDSLWRELVYKHPAGKYELLFKRDWHAVVDTETHLVLRLIVRGEFIAQSTITPWNKANPAKTAEENRKEFLEAIAKQPGWKSEKEVWSGDTGWRADQTIFSRIDKGTQDGIAVMQSFQLITAKDGQQVVVACVTRPEMIEKLGDRNSHLAEQLRILPAK